MSAKGTSDKVEENPLATVEEVFSFAESRATWIYLFLGSFFSAVAGSAYPLCLLYFSRVVGDLSAIPEKGMDPVVEHIDLMVVIGVVSFVSETLQAGFFETAANEMTMNMKKHWFEAVVRQDMAYFDLNDISGTAATISAQGAKFKMGLSKKLGHGIQYSCTVIVGFILAFYFCWEVTLAAIATVPLISVALGWVLKLNQTKSARDSASYSKAGGIVYQVVSNIRTVLALNAADEMIGRFTSATSEAYDGAVSQLTHLGLANGCLMASYMATYMIVCGYGTFILYDEVRENGCDPSGAIEHHISCRVTGADVFLALMGVVFGGVMIPQVSTAFESFTGTRAACFPAIVVISRKSETGDEAVDLETAEYGHSLAKRSQIAALPKYEIDVSARRGKRLSSLMGTIEFHDVQFAYPTRMNKNVFDGFNLKIEAGKTVALVGPSGSGKSTAIQLIERFYDPTSGMVTLDGVELTELNVEWLRSQIGMVGQEPALFATTIKENIRMGSPDASDEEVEAAARQANAHDFICGLQDGYDTYVGDKGAQLSGGQKQRIAIARTLILDPKIILLDEATSALDSESEAIVQEALDSIMTKGAATVVVIAHRLSTIRKADMIAVVNDGKVTETGNHSELLRKRGIYYDLVQAQKKKSSKLSDSVHSFSSDVTFDTSMSKLDTSLSNFSASSFSELEFLQFENDEEEIVFEVGNTAIDIQDVRFSYPSRPGCMVFRGLGLEVDEGETLAIVGPSGQGKSTIIQLLEEFYRPSNGHIDYNGDDIIDLNVRWYRNEIGLVSQEPTLFDGTIAENIKFGMPEATQEDVEDAARKANAHMFISEFPDGYNTHVGTVASSQISGGQKQRIAIARALLRKPKVLLLDEATSALDSESEKVVQEALENVMMDTNLTTIVIAHRLSTIRNADKIAYIERGKIREVGTYDELMALPHGRYKRLEALQTLDEDANTMEVLDKKRTPDRGVEMLDVTKKVSISIKPEPKLIDADAEKMNLKKAKELAKEELPYFALGSLGALLSGVTYPGQGLVYAFMIEILYQYTLPCEDGLYVMDGYANCQEYRDAVATEMMNQSFKTVALIVGLIVCAIVGNIMMYKGFGTATERINKRVRDKAFKALIRQEVGWYDIRSVGQIASQLSDDAAMIHSFSGEPIRTFVMAISSVGVGLVASFFCMWEFAFVALGILPVMAFGEYVQVLQMQGSDEGDATKTSSKSSEGAIVVETLVNIRSVAALRMENMQVKKYNEVLHGKVGSNSWMSNSFHNMGRGLGSFFQMSGYALMNYFGSWCLENRGYEMRDYLIALFGLMLSLTGLATAMAGLTDSGKAREAASRIFELIERKSEIDPLSEEGGKQTTGFDAPTTYLVTTSASDRHTFVNEAKIMITNPNRESRARRSSAVDFVVGASSSSTMIPTASMRSSMLCMMDSRMSLLQAKSEKSEESAPLATISEVFSFAESPQTRMYLVLGSLCACVAGMSLPMMLLYFSRAMGEIAAVLEEGIDPVIDVVYAMVIIGVVCLVTETLQAGFFETAANEMAANLKKKWFEAMVRQDMAYFDLCDVAGTATTLATHANKFRTGLGLKFGHGFQYSSTVIGGFTVAFISSWRVSLAGVTGWVLRLNQTKSARDSASYSKAGSIVYQVAANIRTILALNATEEMIGRFTYATGEAFDGAVSQLLYLGLANGFLLATFMVAYLVVCGYGSYLLYDEVRETGCDPSGAIVQNTRCALDGADVFLALLGIIFAGITMPQVSASFEAFTGARAACFPAMLVISRKSDSGDENLDAENFIHHESLLARSFAARTLPKYHIDSISYLGKKPESISGTIEFHGVQFAYPTRRNVNVFAGFSLRIEAGKTVALVGPSGSGKSTAIQLIERFYDPSTGSVTLDGIDLRELNVGWLRSHIGLVSQEPTLYSTTIRENIRIAKPEALDEEVETAAKQANAHEFITGLQEAYATEVGDKGSQLSGGQKQRIAIARMLLMNPKIILLDEATSALDSESEAIVQRALDLIMAKGTATVVVIAHRLSTIRNADMIVVVDQGKVVETGSHHELISNEGKYYDLVQAQQQTKQESSNPQVTHKDDLSVEETDLDLATIEGGGPEIGRGETDRAIIDANTIDFSYPSRPENQIFRGFELHVHEGKTVAIVGPSGQGKSTIVQLLEEFYRPDKGSIAYNGDDIADLNVNWYRNELGLVSQEPTLFDGTVAENIKFGMSGASQQEIEEAAKKANAHKFILDFPDGYNTVVGTASSSQISGGQKQRIAIARALLRKPKVLLLDEATSALDSESEKVVQEALNTVMKDTQLITIVIAHRLSTIRGADVIVYLEHGRVQELGTYEELMARPNGRYKRLEALQTLDGNKRRSEILGSMRLSETNLEPGRERKVEETLEDSTEEKETTDIDEETAKQNEKKAKELAREELPLFIVGAFGGLLSGVIYPGQGMVFAYMIEILYKFTLPCEDGGEIPDGFSTCQEYWDDIADFMRDQSFKTMGFIVGLMACSILGNMMMFKGFGTATERINKRVRDKAFKALIRQEVGWFDLRSVGHITSQISDDAAMIHSFSGEPIRTFAMTFSSVGVGLVASFYCMWEFAFVAVGILPFFAFGEVVQVQKMLGSDEGDATKAATQSPEGKIVVDTLVNIRSVAALRMEEMRIREYHDILDEKNAKNSWILNSIGNIGLGLGAFFQMAGYGLLNYFGGWCLQNRGYSMRQYLIALFGLMLSLTGTATAMAGLTDSEKARQAAVRIFSLIERQTHKM
eukprot:Nitzschia sp. Nitz4//scaffold281_size24464//5181//15824//NITZ4_008397-RA/size24464-snap-gene-0.2-mRNA-1//-1//CDS//3329545607//886//frame0